VTPKELWWYEARRCGTVPLGLPVAAATLLGIFLSDFALWAQWALSVGFTLLVGLCAAAVAASERMTELQLTMPTTLPSTMCRRFALLLSPAVASAAFLVMFSPGQPGHSLSPLLPIVAFMGLLTATAAWAAMTLRSQAGASTVVIVVWLAKLFVVEQLITQPVSQTVALLAMTTPVFALAMRRLTDGEALIGKESQ